MKNETRKCITALLNCDPTVSQPIRVGILRLLQTGRVKESRLLSIAEAAKCLRVHPKTLLRYGREGRVELVKLSRRKVLIRDENSNVFSVKVQGLKLTQISRIQIILF